MKTNRFDFDKAEWQWESASDLYCTEFRKSADALTDEGRAIIGEYAANRIAFF